jgi:nucleotide-binding universal stress UspA family protein
MIMNDKIITLATLTYEKAQLVQSLLKSEGIDCFLEHINLIQGAISTGVQINIREIDFEQAMVIFDAIRESDFESKHHKLKLDKYIKILVPVDFSEYSQKAVDIAFDWVKTLKGEITLFNAYYSPVHTGLPFSDSYVYDINAEEMGISMQEESQKKIDAIKASLHKKIKELNLKDVKVTSVLKRGIAEHEILEYSQYYKPSIIVMGTRGADKKAVDLIGSVTAEIMELAKTPVLAVPESFQYQGIENIKTIGYLAIFEEPDFYSLEKLSNIVHPLGMSIECCHITSSSDVNKNKVKMDGLGEHFRKNPTEAPINFSLIENEDFWVGIESFIQKKNIDILSFTTYKKSLISRILNPNMAKKMLFHSTTALLVYHA